ncbi:TPR and ankyrin repeat-containing 1-like isoform X1, partial [Paramuricea clavata]
MDMVHSRNYDRAVHLLQLAENYFRPLNIGDQSMKPRWYESWKLVIFTFWCGKMYGRAIQAGKEWQQMEPITNEEEAIGWRDKGNEMFHIGKYGNAIDCFTLSIQYASVHDVTLGMLYSNRSHAYFKKKQFEKAKEDAEKCVKYRPNWSESYLRLGSAIMALNDIDHALEVLMRGLTMNETAEKVKYDIVHKIMTLAYNYK